jgi:hypothetical protein
MDKVGGCHARAGQHDKEGKRMAAQVVHVNHNTLPYLESGTQDVDPYTDNGVITRLIERQRKSQSLPMGGPLEPYGDKEAHEGGSRRKVVLCEWSLTSLPSRDA